MKNLKKIFILGFLFALFAAKSHLNHQLKLFLAVGVCGGFTTFSTFSVEAMCLLNEGKIFQLGAYITLSFFLCILGALIGAYFAKYV
jgi:CrcB protein